MDGARPTFILGCSLILMRQERGVRPAGVDPQSADRSAGNRGTVRRPNRSDSSTVLGSALEARIRLIPVVTARVGKRHVERWHEFAPAPWSRRSREHSSPRRGLAASHRAEATRRSRPSQASRRPPIQYQSERFDRTARRQAHGRTSRSSSSVRRERRGTAAITSIGSSQESREFRNRKMATHVEAPA
jgi:hypothetical protein